MKTESSLFRINCWKSNFLSPVARRLRSVSKFCPNCGTALPPGVKFCPECGTSLPREHGKTDGLKRTSKQNIPSNLGVFFQEGLSYLTKGKYHPSIITIPLILAIISFISTLGKMAIAFHLGIGGLFLFSMALISIVVYSTFTYLKMSYYSSTRSIQPTKYLGGAAAAATILLIMSIAWGSASSVIQYAIVLTMLGWGLVSEKQ